MGELYLVTGAAGFIGRSIAAMLLTLGERVRGVDNFITGKRANLIGLERMEFIEGDLTDPEVCRRACSGAGIVFHEAALPSVPRSIQDPITSNHNNVTGTLNLLEAARHARVRRVIYAGSSSAYGNTPDMPKHENILPAPISPYAVSKLTGEHYMRCYAQVYGLETVVLRYFNVFGPHQDPTSQYSGVLAKFTLAMLRGETPIVFGDGEQSRDFTYIDNVIQGNLRAAIAPAATVSGQVFNVAAGAQITLNQAVATLRELTGYAGPVEHREDRAGDIKHTRASIEKARKAFGYAPTETFANGMVHTVNWYRSLAGQG